jgi:gliding motility-associated-like protein
MKKLMIFLLFMLTLGINNLSAQCTNADFSSGDFSNWQGSTGENSAGIYSSIVNGIVQGVTNSDPIDVGRHTIINAPGTDPNTGNLLSILPPSGTSCARLGNMNYNGEAERLIYPVLVSTTNSSFTYQYAVVLEDAGHTATEQPKFSIRVTDPSGDVFDATCGIYEVTAAAGIPGFNTSSAYDDGETVRWKDWTTVGIDLSAYIGSTVNIEFTTYDCAIAQGAHFGYAYIACHCGSLDIDQICSGTDVVLTAPAGFSSYLWTPSGATTQSISLNSPVNGTIYSCTCTSVQGCNLVVTDTINIEPVIFTVNNDVICSGENTTLNVTPTGTYTYEWDTGDLTQSINVSPNTTTTYTVTATATGGCANSQNATVTVNPTPAGTTTSTQATCAGNDGSITVNMSIGTAPFIYQWSTVPVQNTQTANNLPAGTYTVTVTDANSCSTSITGTITSNEVLTTTANSTNETCGQSNGTATVNVMGSGNYTYEWNSTPPQYTQTATNLPANTYTVTVTDGICTATADVPIINLAGPSALITNITNTTCGYSNGSVIASGSGGFPTYTYEWNSTPPQYTANMINVPAGTYIVTVTDTQGCQATNSVTLTDTPGPSITFASNNETCDMSNGTATVSVIGGQTPYTYQWQDNQTNPTAINLPQGNYSVVVTDDNGCTVSGSVNVNETNGPTASFSASPKILTIMDETVSFLDNSSGNVVQWNWNLGDGSFESSVSFDHSYGIGTYTVTLIITDDNGCTDTTVDTIKVKDIYTFYIPNTFTPNGDGYNDYFYPQGVNVDPEKFNMYIFDRWGNLIFHTTEWDSDNNRPLEFWNGTEDNKGTFENVLMDVYVYKISTKELEGTKHEYIGRIDLIP